MLDTQRLHQGYVFLNSKSRRILTESNVVLTLWTFDCQPVVSQDARGYRLSREASYPASCLRRGSHVASDTQDNTGSLGLSVPGESSKIKNRNALAYAFLITGK